MNKFINYYKMSITIFDKIINKEIPVKAIYEDEKSIAFMDINAVAKFHCLLIPKQKGRLDRLLNAEEADADILGHLMVTVAKIAKQQNLEEGFRVVINDGKFGG